MRTHANILSKFGYCSSPAANVAGVATTKQKHLRQNKTLLWNLCTLHLLTCQVIKVTIGDLGLCCCCCCFCDIFPNSSSLGRWLSPSFSMDVRNGGQREKNSGIRDEVPEVTSPHLVQRAQDQ